MFSSRRWLLQSATFFITRFGNLENISPNVSCVSEVFAFLLYCKIKERKGKNLGGVKEKS